MAFAGEVSAHFLQDLQAPHSERPYRSFADNPRDERRVIALSFIKGTNLLASDELAGWIGDRLGEHGLQLAIGGGDLFSYPLGTTTLEAYSHFYLQMGNFLRQISFHRTVRYSRLRSTLRCRSSLKNSSTGTTHRVTVYSSSNNFSLLVATLSGSTRRIDLSGISSGEELLHYHLLLIRMSSEFSGSLDIFDIPCPFSIR